MGTHPRRPASLSTITTREAGMAAENLACSYLQAQGLRLLTRNYRCRQGEIDLIMQDRTHLVFIEVRYRKSTNFGYASETVSRPKQKRLISTAWHYLFEHNKARTACVRFDVIGIDHSQNINWIKNAFEGSL